MCRVEIDGWIIKHGGSGKVIYPINHELEPNLRCMKQTRDLKSVLGITIVFNEHNLIKYSAVIKKCHANKIDLSFKAGSAAELKRNWNEY